MEQFARQRSYKHPNFADIWNNFHISFYINPALTFLLIEKLQKKSQPDEDTVANAVCHSRENGNPGHLLVSETFWIPDQVRDDIAMSIS